MKRIIPQGNLGVARVHGGVPGDIADAASAMYNIQVTHETSLDNARSESSLVINPKNPQQIVAGSKKFINYHTYNFTLATSYSIDAGRNWKDSATLALLPGWTGISDPALAWDDSGNVFLVALAFNNPPTPTVIGIAIYKSTDGGKTWSAPKPIHTSAGDDKQWAAGDGNPASPFHGRVYAVWDDGSVMRFARTKDHGATWVGAGVGATPAGSVLVNGSFSPEINVAANGDIYIVFLNGNPGTQINMLVSTDGGDNFHAVASPATTLTTLGSVGPKFPGENFRVITVPTACVFGSTILVAWADRREGPSRIYYALSTNGGISWSTGPSGQPLLTGALDANLHHFHPQMAADPNGVFGCAFYEFGPKPTTPRIDVIMAQSFDGGGSFHHSIVTDQPWDPAVDAPWVRGDPNLTFIGEYFGLDASINGFYPLWTDTRTGIQQLWMDILPRPWNGGDLTTVQNIVSVSGHFSTGDQRHLVVVGTTQGKVHEIFWKPLQVGIEGEDDLPVAFAAGTIVSVAALYNSDQQRHVVLVGKTDGKVHEISWKPETIGVELHQNLPVTFNPGTIVAVSGLYDSNQQRHLAFVATTAGKVHEIYWKADTVGVEGHDDLPVTFAPGSIVAVSAFYDTDQHRYIVVVGTSARKLHEIFWKSDTDGVEGHDDVPVSFGSGSIVAVSGFYDSEQKRYVVVVGTSNGEVHEVFWKAFTVGIEGRRVVTQLSPNSIRSLAGFYSASDRIQHIIVGLANGLLREFWVKPNM